MRPKIFLAVVINSQWDEEQYSRLEDAREYAARMSQTHGPVWVGSIDGDIDERWEGGARRHHFTRDNRYVAG